MSFRDIVNNVAYYSAFKDVIDSDTTTYTEYFDTAIFSHGIGFFANVLSYADGTYTITLQHSEDHITWEDVPDDRQIFPDTNCVISADIPVKNYLPKVGAFSTYRYVRAKIVSTGITTSGAVLDVIFAGVGYIKPVTKENY